jgi:manganese transport protein
MAVILQVISAWLGVATGKDLAQCCRDWYPNWSRWPNWIAMEIAIGATDLAESLGSAVALNLLFHIPLSWAIIITAFDVLATIGICYGIEIFVLPALCRAARDGRAARALDAAARTTTSPGDHSSRHRHDSARQ